MNTSTTPAQAAQIKEAKAIFDGIFEAIYQLDRAADFSRLSDGGDIQRTYNKISDTLYYAVRDLEAATRNRLLGK